MNTILVNFGSFGTAFVPSRGVEGGTPLSKLYRYVPPHRVGFLRRFCLKTDNTLDILVWNRVWFSRELRECMNVFNQFNTQ